MDKTRTRVKLLQRFTTQGRKKGREKREREEKEEKHQALYLNKLTQEILAN